MKRIMHLVTVLMLLAIAGCSKKSGITVEETPTRFPLPDWKADATGKYASSMTAVLSLPANLYTNLDNGDKLAAFVNDECRGMGVMVKVGSSNLFFVLIQGTAGEQAKVTFKYYSTKTAFTYESPGNLSFLVDAIYGTAENPKTIDLSPVN